MPGRAPKGTALDVLSLIRSGAARTRSELIAQTGLSRSTISQRLTELFDQNLIAEGGEATSSGGRPASLLSFNRSAGVVVAAAIGVTASRVAVVDLGGEVLAENEQSAAIAAGPTAILEDVAVRANALLTELDVSTDRLWGFGAGLPGPVEFASGRPVSPPIMPGWDSFPVGEWLEEHFRCQVLVDNDVNVMALGEHHEYFPHQEQLIFVKVGTGIGAGLIADGEIYRGAQGSAGDIGHIYVPGHDDVVCECGNTGCLEAIAGGRALARRLDLQGLPSQGSADVVAHVLKGRREALLAVREAGREIGLVLAGLVNAFNPGMMVLGGTMVGAGDHLLAAVREVIYRRSPPLATRNLRIVSSSAGERAGVIGAASMITRAVLTRRSVSGAIA